MATITLNANYGKGEFKNLGLSFNSAKQNTSNLASSLQKLKNKVISVETVADAVAIGKPASTTVKNAEKREENKKSALSVAYEKLDQLLSDVGSIDDKVAGAITANKKAFYKKYSWLKPECEKGFFEKARDYLWGKVCSISSAIKNTFIKVGKWLKKHWKDLLTFIVAIVAAALIVVLAVLTFGAATVIFAAVVGAVVGLAKQLIKDTIKFLVTGKWESSWIDYLSAALGGALDGIFELFGMKIIGAGASSFISSLFNSSLKNMTGQSNESLYKIWKDAFFEAGCDMIFELMDFGGLNDVLGDAFGDVFGDIFAYVTGYVIGEAIDDLFKDLIKDGLKIAIPVLLKYGKVEFLPGLPLNFKIIPGCPVPKPSLVMNINLLPQFIPKPIWIDISSLKTQVA